MIRKILCALLCLSLLLGLMPAMAEETGSIPLFRLMDVAEDGSERLCVMAGYKTSDEMLSDIKKAYSEVAAAEGFDGIIPSGEIFGALLKSGVAKIHRDTFHASLGLGRYALGLLWFKVLTGKSVIDNGFCELDEPADENEIKAVKQYVEQLVL